MLQKMEIDINEYFSKGFFHIISIVNLIFTCFNKCKQMIEDWSDQPNKIEMTQIEEFINYIISEKNRMYFLKKRHLENDKIRTLLEIFSKISKSKLTPIIDNILNFNLLYLTSFLN